MLSSISKSILALFVLFALFASLVDAFPVRDTTLAARHAAVARRQASGSCKPAPATQPDEDDEDEEDEDDDEEEEYDQPAKPATTGRPAASGAASATPPASTGRPANGTSNQSGSAPANLGGSRALFPAGLGNQALTWSTSNKISGALPLSDSTFRLFNNIADLEHPYVNAPDGVRSMRVTYPRGTAALSGRDTPRGGVSFYARGPVDLTRAKEATLSFSVLFQSGFQFNHGGKLPGLYGGESDGGAVSCSGGRQDTTCFSTRFMWRDGGAFEGYFYLPPVAANKNGFCRTGGVSCNDQYGASVSRGAFRFQPGVRTTIAQRVKLNDVGRANGEVEMYHNGQSIRKLTGLVLRNRDSGRIRGIQMQSFFGGHGPYWVSPQTQNSYFGDFSVSVTETF